MPILSELSRLPDSTDQIAWKGSMCAELAVVPLQEEVQSLCAGGAAGHDSALLLFPDLQTHSTNTPSMSDGIQLPNETSDTPTAVHPGTFVMAASIHAEKITDVRFTDRA
jgi:hypothetical protein